MGPAPLDRIVTTHPFPKPFFGRSDVATGSDRTGQVSGRAGTDPRVGTTGRIEPSSSNQSRSIVTSRCIPSPPGMANR